MAIPTATTNNYSTISSCSELIGAISAIRALPFVPGVDHKPGWLPLLAFDKRLRLRIKIA